MLGQQQVTGVDEINKQSAKDTRMLDGDTDSGSSASSANNQGLSQDMQDDPDSFARGLGLSTQVIAEVNRGLDEEQDAIGSQLVGGDFGEETNRDQILQTKKVELGGVLRNVSQEKDNIVDENRRTSRNVTDQHVMEKAMDRAKVKNLEFPIGKSTSLNFPTVLNAAHEKLESLAATAGVKLGGNEKEIKESVEVLKMQFI